MQAQRRGIASYPEFLRDIVSTDINVSVQASKNLLAIAESTQCSEQIPANVIESVLNALRSPHTQVLCNVTSILFWIAYGNSENQRALVGIRTFLPLMAEIIKSRANDQTVRQEQANAVHALSQVVFADPDTAIAIVSTPGILNGMVSMMKIGAERASARTARDIAALAVNNCAGIGGEEASGKIASEPGMLELLRAMALTGTPEEKTRATSVCYHISRSTVAQQLMIKAQIPAALANIISTRGSGEEFEAQLALATMALTNLVGGSRSSSDVSMSPASISLITKYLQYAIKGQRYGGISWRVYDVLFPLSVLAKNSEKHGAMMDAGVIEVLLKLLDDWRQGQFDVQFTRAKAAEFPIVALTASILENMAKTGASKQKIMNGGGLRVADKLTRSSPPVVATYMKSLASALGQPAQTGAPVKLGTPTAKPRIEEQVLQTPTSPFTDSSKELEFWKLKAEQLANRNEVLIGTNEDLLAEQQRLKAEILEAEEGRREANKTLDKIEHEKRIEVKKMASDLARAQESEAELQSLIVKLRRENESKTASLEKQSFTETAKLKADIEELKGQISRLEKQLKQETARADKLNFDVQKIQEDKQLEIDGLVTKLQGEKRNSSSSFDSMKKKLEEAQKDNEMLIEESKVKHRWIEKVKKELEESIVDLEQKKKKLEEDNLQKDGVIAERNTTIQEIDKQLSESRKFANDLHDIASELLMTEHKIVIVDSQQHDYTSLVLDHEEMLRFKQSFVADIAAAVGCSPQRLKVLLVQRTKDAKGVRVHLEVIPAENDPTGVHAKDIAIQLEKMIRNSDSKLFAKPSCGRIRLGAMMPKYSESRDAILDALEMSESIISSKNQQVIRFVLRKWANSDKGRYFDLWRTDMTKNRRSRLVFRRICNRSVVMSLNRWKESIEEMQKMRIIASKIVYRWQNQAVNQAFSTWSNNVWELKKFGSIFQKIRVRFLNTSLIKAFARWAYIVTEEGRLQRVGGAVMKRWMLMGVTMCFNTWHEEMVEEKRKRKVLQKITVRWTKGGMASAFAMWKDSCFMEVKMSEMLAIDDKLKELQTGLETKVQELRELKLTSEDEISRLQSKMDLLVGEKDQLISDLKNRLKNQDGTLQHADQSVANLKQTIEDERNKLRQITDELNAAEVQLNEMRMQNANLQRNITRLDQEMENIVLASREREGQLVAEKEDLESRLRKMQMEMKNSAQEWGSAEASYIKDVKSLQERLSSTERSLQASQLEREQLQAQAAAEMQSMRTELEVREKKTRDLERRLEEQHQNIMWLDAELEKQKRKSAGGS
uniref:Uncharacterized protein n=1 Tax=Hanusia phi TaxID=3032 RepID=A0A6T7T890_9CRYP|mmetsp:Transcript_4998/g.11804  ORF Transcript_4998/g.11804 Transcript_4998/m.11804 type:complete len:1292 (+) Transcript_4998:46-3921(+)